MRLFCLQLTAAIKNHEIISITDSSLGDQGMIVEECTTPQLNINVNMRNFIYSQFDRYRKMIAIIKPTQLITIEGVLYVAYIPIPDEVLPIATAEKITGLNLGVMLSEFHEEMQTMSDETDIENRNNKKLTILAPKASSITDSTTWNSKTLFAMALKSLHDKLDTIGIKQIKLTHRQNRHEIYISREKLSIWIAQPVAANTDEPIDNKLSEHFESMTIANKSKI